MVKFFKTENCYNEAIVLLELRQYTSKSYHISVIYSYNLGLERWLDTSNETNCFKIAKRGGAQLPQEQYPGWWSSLARGGRCGTASVLYQDGWLILREQQQAGLHYLHYLWYPRVKFDRIQMN